MQLRDYLQMLRRGWPVMAIFVVAAVTAAVLYLAIAPKTYHATASVVLVTNAPQSIGDAQQGGQLAQSSAATIASVIDSPVVLTLVSSKLDTPIAAGDLANMVSTSSRANTAVIDILVAGSDAQQAADIANSTSASAAIVVDELGRNGDSTAPAPLRLEQIAAATAALEPASPNQRGVLLIAVIIGLALGLGVAVLRQALDTRIYSPEDLRRLNDAPLLASIQRSRRRTAAHRLALKGDQFGSDGEGFRTLRTNLGYLQSSDRHCFALVSAGDVRDSASTAVNLGISFAQAGRRTLLIDSDLRRDAVGDLLGHSHSTGLADVLGGPAGLATVINATDDELLDVVFAGTPQRNPSDLLSLPRMSSLLRLAETDYDDVILHAPSLTGSSDAAVVARAAGWTILTVAAGRVTADQFDEALSALARVRVTPVGTVLVAKRPGLISALNVKRPTPSHPDHEHQFAAPSGTV